MQITHREPDSSPILSSPLYLHLTAPQIPCHILGGAGWCPWLSQLGPHREGFSLRVMVQQAVWIPCYLLSYPEQEGDLLLLCLAGQVCLPGVLGLQGTPTQGEQHELNVSNLLLAAGSWQAGTQSGQESRTVPSLSPLLSSSRCPIPVAAIEHSGTVAVWPWGQAASTSPLQCREGLSCYLLGQQSCRMCSRTGTHGAPVPVLCCLQLLECDCVLCLQMGRDPAGEDCMHGLQTAWQLPGLHPACSIKSSAGYHFRGVFFSPTIIILTQMIITQCGNQAPVSCHPIDQVYEV